MLRRVIGAGMVLVWATISFAPGRGQAQSVSPQAASFASTVQSIEALPYQAAYVPAGTDSAFPGTVPNTAPAQDYTSGSIPGSPDDPAWPPAFKQVTIHSADGAALLGMLALQPSGTHPSVLVVHGFNTHGIESVKRWAAMLFANGYNVLAADQRDFSFEYSAGYGYPKALQTFGWKEAQDVLAAGTYLHSQPGVAAVGVVGFSEGAQNTVLAMGEDTAHVFSAGITFSGPADQDTQIYSTSVPPNCQTPACTYPSTDALITLVVPPYTYTDPCAVLNDAAAYYHVTPYSIMTQETAMHAQREVSVPLLNFYAADDPLVKPYNAQLMDAYTAGNGLQRTVEIQQGNHAYFYDRWWQQAAILRYFKDLLPADASTGVTPTVNQTPAGTPLSGQLVAFARLTTAQADAMLAPFICDTTKPAPGNAGAGATYAAVQRFSVVHRSGRLVARWQVVNPRGIAGFRFYAGSQLLAALPVHASRSYRYVGPWHSSRSYRLEVLLSTGATVTMHR